MNIDEMILKCIGIMICGMGIGAAWAWLLIMREISKKDEKIRRLKAQNLELNGKLSMTADELYTRLLKHET